jgi:hypothetical protein
MEIFFLKNKIISSLFLFLDIFFFFLEYKIIFLLLKNIHFFLLFLILLNIKN